MSRLVYGLVLSLLLIGGLPAGADAAPGSDIRLAGAGYNDNTVHGRTVTVDYFLPGPGDYPLAAAGTQVTLVFSASALLSPDSVLTVLWNGLPVLDERLPASDSRTSLNIPLPSDRTDPTVNHLQVVGLLQVAHTTCATVDDDPAQHLTIYGDTTVHYALTGSDPVSPVLTPDLGRFPWPFFEVNQPNPSGVVFVLPRDPTDQEIQAAVEVGATLGRAASNKTIPISAVADSGTLTSDLSPSNLIFVGRSANLPSLRSMPDLPAEIGSGGAISSDGNPLPADSGALLELRSPLGPGHLMLAVTGQTDVAVAKAAQALATPLSPSVLHGSFAAIGAAPSSGAASVPNAGQVTLAQLGHSDITVSGAGEHTESFQLDVPGAIDPRSGIPLQLVISHSGLLDMKQSSVRVSLNGVPVSETALGNVGAVRGSTTVTLPANAVLPGQNTVDVLFRLRLPAGDTNCALPPDAQAWTVLHADSSISFPQKAASVNAVSLDSFPYPFAEPGEGLGATTVVVPDQLSDAGALLQLGSDLGGRTSSGSLSPRVLRASEVHIEDLATNCVLWGLPVSNPQIGRLAPYLPLTVTSGAATTFSLNGDIRLSLKEAADAGVVEEIASPWSPGHFLLVVSATTANGQTLAVRALRQGGLRGNLALATASTDPNAPKGSVQLTSFDLKSPAAQNLPIPVPILIAAISAGAGVLLCVFLAYQAFVAQGDDPR
ncbi:MAG: cellulose biosynthesis cyclic di-GMP-binding regulatory protein BcsB [Chloroflexi bacterium]|nr:cellulose biosynthesis cyclic di-GMP-binding regulatory protein BcsB [Chloroflexota bacterium]